MRLEIAEVAALDVTARTEIIDLCNAAYREDFSRWFDELPGSVHVLARADDSALVSHAAWVTRWLQPSGQPLLRTAYVEAVATAPAHQGRGLATAVMRHLQAAVTSDHSWQLAALSPSAPGFYSRLGWELWQGPLAIRRAGQIEPTPADEQVMILRLPRTPAAILTTELLTAEWRAGELW